MGNILDNRQSRQRSNLPFITGAADSLTNSVISAVDLELAKLFEDRNILLTQGGLITFLGTQVQFSEALKIEINSKIAGGPPVIIDLGSATKTISASGKMIYAVIDRTAGSATVYDDADTLPSVTNANQEVFLIAKRQDSADGLKRLYFRNGTALNEGQSVRLGASGTGGGDTNELLERLKTRLVNSPFEWVEPNIFFTDGEDKIDSATASFYLVKNLYQYTAAGQNIVSVQSLDPEFLEEEKDLDSIELLAFWNAGFVDSNATYEVSRNGGVNWVTVSMERAGSTTETYRGILNFPQDTTYITLHQHTGFTTYKELDATSNQAVAQRFDIASSTAEVLQKLTLEISKTGSPSGYTYAQIIRDGGSGTPSTDPLDIVAQKEILNSTLSAGDNSVSLSIGTNTLKAGTYFLVVATDTAYKASYSLATHSVKLKTDAVLPIGSHGVNVQNLGVWGAEIPETLIHSIQGRPLDLRVRITSSAGIVELKGYGLLYGRQQQVTNGLKNREVISFDGTVDNLNEFTLSNFLPDRDLLKVYHVETGQTYVPGTNSFYLDGRKAIFPIDTFNGLGTVTLVFDQVEGVSFDNSETNGALLAANFLGSTDALIDKSQAGRGIMLRSPDGSLYEITIQNGGAGFDIYLVT